MAKSKITGKTFEEMLSESTELDLSAKFKDIIYEFSNDVHAMGIVVYTYEEGSAKFLFKDPAFTQPVTDYELLAMYLDEVVATRLADENTSLERCRDLEAEKVKYLEYKEGDFVKRFYKIGEYYSGETYNDLNGFVPGGMPLVGTAVVGVDKVAENEPVPMQTIWEGTFVAESSGGQYRYETPNVQNGNLIKNCNEVSVTFDGATYVLPVEQGSMGYVVEATDFAFAFVVESPSSTVIASLMIIAQTEGEHIIKVEGTPSGDEPSELIILFNGRPSSGSSTNVGDFIQFELPAEDLAELLDYDYVTLSQEGQGMAKLSIHLGTVDGHQIAYAGGDTYPPTSLIDPPNMMVYYTEDDGSDTETSTSKAYVLFEKPSGIWQIPNIGIAVDPNDEVPQAPKEKY